MGRIFRIVWVQMLSMWPVVLMLTTWRGRHAAEWTNGMYGLHLLDNSAPSCEWVSLGLFPISVAVCVI